VTENRQTVHVWCTESYARSVSGSSFLKICFSHLSEINRRLLFPGCMVVDLSQSYTEVQDQGF